MNLKNYETVNENRNPKHGTDSSPQGPKYPSGSGPAPLHEPPASPWEKLLRLAALGLALLCLAATQLHACGPTFPNNLLDLGDNAVLLAPVADFQRELEGMKLVPVRFRAVPVPDEKSFSDQTADTEISELRVALRKAKVSREETEHICAAQQAERGKLKQFLEDFDPFAEPQPGQADGGTQPKFPQIALTSGLPGEFADYFAGAIAWHDPAITNKSLAREPWERLLARPPAERKYKSTWAAFMLGKSWDGLQPAKAVAYFRQVRELARNGFADSLGLAAASFGLEARAYYQGGNHLEAIKLYLDQLATGDDTARASLQQVAAAALENPATLRDLATNALARQVITAYVISWQNLDRDESGNPLASTNAIIRSWLSAVEAAGVEDVESAEKLALAAYQAGAFDLAQGWIARSSNAPVAQWIQAKLLLRAGKTAEAAAVLAKVTQRLPVLAESGQHGKADFADALFMKFYAGDAEDVPARRQVLGELGVVQLSRGEFTQALDALLRAGFWMDAACVAERVLTVAELKDYVDRHWPPPADARVTRAREEAPEQLADAGAALQTPEATPDSDTLDAGSSPALFSQNIRYLLGRRLTRALQGSVAREYFPVEWRTNFDELMTALIAGWDETQPAAQRATSLFSAARIARSHGMELLGTEGQPDWHVHGGNFEEGVTWEGRAANARHAVINVASAAEIQRASRHTTDPERRFHYRYQAAFLGWEAAKLMPNDNDDTAMVLWPSGSWLKGRDPQTADIFYKALVRRCRKTALGSEADLQRWFPKLDEPGNDLQDTALGDTDPMIAPDSVEPLTGPAEQPSTSSLSDRADSSDPFDEIADPLEAEHGYQYVIHSGDTLTAIARAYEASGVSVSIQDLLDANPGIEPTRLGVGRVIFVPVVKQ